MMNELVSKFKELYKQEPVLVRAPLSLSTALELPQFGKCVAPSATACSEIYFAIAPNGLHLCRVHAFNQKQSDAFFLMQRMSRSSRSWENAIKAVVAQYLKAGYELEGFDLVFGTTEQSVVGLSPASIEQGFTYVLNHLFNFYVEEFMLANAAQKAEHVIA